MQNEPSFPWMNNKPDTFRFHLENDTGTAFDYTRSKRRDLGARLLRLRRIYLDTKYWIYARDVYLGRAQKPSHVAIVSELQRLRGAGSTICPISYSVFHELLYQSDPMTRKATAEMIDELSDDCTIQPLFELFKAELYHFYIKTTKPNAPLFEVAQLVWTKAAFVVGDRFLSPKDQRIPKRQANAMEKAMDDMLWEVKLSEFIETLPPDSPNDSHEASSLAETLTQGKFEHWNPKDSFSKLFLDEVAGAVDAFCDVLGDCMTHAIRESGVTADATGEQQLQAGRMLGQLIHGAFKNGRITTEFPTIGVTSALHAAVRLDKNRKFKKGDAEDFHHAAVAVGYFDVFLTESSLKHLLRTKHVNAEEAYDCTVLSTEDEVLRYLRTLT